MARSGHGAVITLVVAVALIWSCKLGATVPSIVVSSFQASGGPVLRASGADWLPGERVIIGLAAPNTQPVDSEAVGSALADATGRFVAIVQLPLGPPWSEMAETWIVAHSEDWERVVTATFDGGLLPATTATPVAAPSAVEPAMAYVLGYVQNVVLEATLIKVRPIEGVAETITLTEDAQILRQGQDARLSDVRMGDLVEATGSNPQGDGTRIVASQVRILMQSTREPTTQPTPETTPSPVPLFWKAEYYNNTTFSGNPVVTREEPVVDYQWQGGPAAEGLPSDGFAVRWTGTWPFEQGVHRIHAQVDDGIRLWLDGHLVIDQWYQTSGTVQSVDAYLSQGSHAVRVEYFEAQENAYARVWWDYRGSEANLSYVDWKGEYYDNVTLSGSPFLIVPERVLDFNWEDGAAVAGMPVDGFSVRWTKTTSLQDGIYRFYARSDDGVRLWLDDALIIDHWQERAAATDSADILVSAREYEVRVEYYEHTGKAAVGVWWEPLPATPTSTATATSTPVRTPTPTPTHTHIPTLTPAATLPTPELTPVSPAESAHLVYFPEVWVPLVPNSGPAPSRPWERYFASKRSAGPAQGW